MIGSLLAKLGSGAGRTVEVAGAGLYVGGGAFSAVESQSQSGPKHAFSAGMEIGGSMLAAEAGYVIGSAMGGLPHALALSIGLSLTAGEFFEESLRARSRYTDPGTAGQFGRGTFMATKSTQKARARHMTMMASGDPNFAASRMANFAILGQEASYMHY